MVPGLKIEDRLEGASNFISWKSKILLILEENDILPYVESEVQEPTDTIEKATWKKNKILAKRIIIDSMKDHLIPSISKLKFAEEMFDSLHSVYEINNTSQALALCMQLLHIKMSKGDPIVSFFLKISELKD